uniref:Cytochrome P450 n=2 Tax=Medicago truncatula TaxID=3880 RepID=I3SJB9_MEDTR|nr:unknown [Medicago truncatula]
MEPWFIVLVTLCIIFLIRAILSLFTTTIPLPPGPLHIPIITNFQLLQKSISQLEPFLKTLHAKHGPIITVHIGSRPSIFINDHTLAHHVLVQNSSIFSDRPTALPTSKMLSSNQHNINTAYYGPTWRTLRRNLASEMLHPSKLKSFSEIRKWVLRTLINRLKTASESELTDSIKVMPHFKYADTLLELEWPEEKRKLSENEMVNLCSEFLNGGTDTTSTSLQWIMANVVKYPEVQGRLVEEIREVMGGDENGVKEEVKEEDLQKLRYLKCVVLEGLRRHPPGKFPLPHAVKEDVVLDGYLVPKNGTVNFLLAEMALDPRVWEDPLEFKPERFLKDETFDITRSKEIKMMPFGAGRRICPGLNLALLHLEYFVANLVWNFDWKVPEGGHVDLTEIQEFTMVMKNPLQVHISPRI